MHRRRRVSMGGRPAGLAAAYSSQPGCRKRRPDCRPPAGLALFIAAELQQLSRAELLQPAFGEVPAGRTGRRAAY